MLDAFGCTNAPPPVAKLASLCSTTSFGSALGGGKFKTTSQREEGGGRTYTDDLGGALTESFQEAFHALERVAV
jgi:hypothetical protein